MHILFETVIIKGAGGGGEGGDAYNTIANWWLHQNSQQLNTLQCRLFALPGATVIEYTENRLTH